MVTSPYVLLGKCIKQMDALMGAHSHSPSVWHGATNDAHLLIDLILHESPHDAIDMTTDYSKAGTSAYAKTTTHPFKPYPPIAIQASVHGKHYVTSAHPFDAVAPPTATVDKCTIKFLSQAAADTWNGGKDELYFKGSLPGHLFDGELLDGELLKQLMHKLGKVADGGQPAFGTVYKYHIQPITKSEDDMPADPPPKGFKWNGSKFVEVNECEPPLTFTESKDGKWKTVEVDWPVKIEHNVLKDLMANGGVSTSISAKMAALSMESISDFEYSAKKPAPPKNPDAPKHGKKFDPSSGKWVKHTYMPNYSNKAMFKGKLK